MGVYASRVWNARYVAVVCIFAYAALKLRRRTRMNKDFEGKVVLVTGIISVCVDELFLRNV